VVINYVLNLIILAARLVRLIIKLANFSTWGILQAPVASLLSECMPVKKILVLALVEVREDLPFGLASSAAGARYIQL
jgi:hypothetical protein